MLFQMDSAEETLAGVQRDMTAVNTAAAAINIDTDDVTLLRRQLILAIGLVQSADMIVDTTEKIVAAAKEVVELARKV
jgi:hypothetical protein